MNDLPLKALVLGCSLRGLPSESSSDVLAQQVLDELSQYNVSGSIIRVVDYNIMPGVKTDMGEGDDWPKLRQQMLEADIFIIATPTWVGHMSSVAQRVIERLDAELSETDSQGRLLTYGKVAAVVVVGNEDGAHKISADLFQSLNDVGFTIAAQNSTYWNDHAMGSTDYKDLNETPKEVASTNKSLAANAAHLARLLKQHDYPAV
ncbi:MAG TPA: NAD(P)H-dependent oxidoreductase [Candidatus Saccharimonadales bacterium]|nr:NAD(P)H-dependent oxidoreductase [Candidatus Saccharimonadales bacterium]